MNVAAFIVTGCTVPSPATLDIIFLSFSHFIIHSIHELCCITSHDEILRNCLLLRVIYHEIALRSLRIARFRREEGRDEDKHVATVSKKLYQVALIDRASYPQLPTLEKTKHGHNPILNNPLKKNYQVSLIYLLLQQNSKDRLFRNISSPGSLKWKTTRPMASSQ